METDPILRLRRKIDEVTKAKERLDQQITNDELDVAKLKERIEASGNETKGKSDRIKQNEDKLKRVEYLIGESEKSLRRIIEASLALDKVLEKETEGK